VRNKTAICGALIACVALQASVARAQGIPVVGGSTDVAEMIREAGALQSQVEAIRASHDTASSNALLVQILTTQRANLAELESIDQHMQRTEADQHLAAQTLQQQFNLEIALLAPSQASLLLPAQAPSQSRSKADPGMGGSQRETALTIDQGQHHATAQ
jgi:hypothetical protein